MADLRFAIRGLARSPLFSTVAILSLALGIGANTAIFTLIDQILLRQLPVKNPEQLVMLMRRNDPYLMRPALNGQVWIPWETNQA